MTTKNKNLWKPDNLDHEISGAIDNFDVKLESAGKKIKPRQPRSKNYFDSIMTNNNIMEAV